ncbi:DUF6959 family protein [Streptomyces virginiae]
MTELVELCASGDLEESRYTAGLLHGDLREKLQRYTEALEAHAARLPF